MGLLYCVSQGLEEARACFSSVSVGCCVDVRAGAVAEDVVVVVVAAEDVVVVVVASEAVLGGRGSGGLFGETGRLGPFRGVYSVDVRGRSGKGVVGRWPVVDGLSRS